MMTESYKHSCISVNNYDCLTMNNHGCSFSGMKFGERLKAARLYAKLTQPGLAEKMGNIVTQQNISLLENGDASGSEFTVHFAVACCIRPEWLATESGSMIYEQVYSVKPNSPEEKMLMVMKHMDEPTKYQLVKIGNTLAEPDGDDGEPSSTAAQ